MDDCPSRPASRYSALRTRVGLKMSKRAKLRTAVAIFGAGASFDSVPENAPHPATVLPDFRPLLTDFLFSNRAIRTQYLKEYPAVRDLAATIVRMLPSYDGSLEKVLSAISETSKLHRAAQLVEVPLYLTDLFWKASEYATPPINYTFLIDQLLDRYDKVAFITLNYDLLLDRALSERTYGGPSFTGMRSYVRDTWALVKLHGSVNWGRRIPIERQFADKREYLSMLSQLVADEKATFDGPIEVLTHPHQFWVIRMAHRIQSFLCHWQARRSIAARKATLRLRRPTFRSVNRSLS